MSSNAPHRLVAAITRTQSSFIVAGAIRYRPLLAPVNSNPHIRTAVIRPFTSFSRLLPSFPGLLVDQGPTQRWWTPKISRSLRSKPWTKTCYERRLKLPLGKRSLKGPTRGALILRHDLRTPLPIRAWSQNGIAWQILRSSSTNNRVEGAFRIAPLPKKSDAQVEKGAPESSEFPAPPTANKHIIDRLPNIPHMHRPTKEELLAAATGFWSRLKVRFKWFSIRSVRPFNVDEIGAFFSWVLLGHVLWIILGTTTFFSLAIFAVNTVFAQGTSLSPSSYVQLMAIQKLWPGG